MVLYSKCDKKKKYENRSIKINKIPYWWRLTTQIYVVLLIGHAVREICFNQSEALPQEKKMESSERKEKKVCFTACDSGKL